MVYCVYILYSHKDERLYIGCTADLGRRVKRHNVGYVEATKNRRPFSLIYSEKFESKADAFNRERFLKSLWGARLKKKILDTYLKCTGSGI